MSDQHFLPFEAHLDRENALKVLNNALRGGDDGEIFLEKRKTESIVLDDGRIRSCLLYTSDAADD